MLNVTVEQFRFNRPETAEKTYPVTAVTLHPQYRESNQTNNIAIVEISGSLIFGEAVQHIYYDSVNYGKCVRSLSLLWDDSENIQANADCSHSQISTFDAPTMLCTAKVSGGSCEFESGAPLIQGNPPVVVGIKSLFRDVPHRRITCLHSHFL